MTPKKYLLLATLIWTSTSVVTRDVGEVERNARAMFIQRILNMNKVHEGRIKLVGGSSPFEGNVYIRHAGRWGAVCGAWGAGAAAVVCARYNRSGEAVRGAFGHATEKFWLSNVVCDGDESHLTHCRFPGWGAPHCQPSEAVGVKCVRGEKVPMKTLPKAKIHEVLDVARSGVRLAGGRDRNEGRVELYHNGVWGSLCPAGWSLHEALVVCRHLNLGFASAALQTDLFGSSKPVMSGVQCQGNETSLFQCRHGMFGDVSCLVDEGRVAAVACTQTLADLQLDPGALETAHLQDVPMYLLQCALEENCLTKSAYELQSTEPSWPHHTRRLLRFTAASMNVGNADFRPHLPRHLWQWHLCHMHYHSMEVFATFDILNSSGARVAEGHKASFCLEDNTCMEGVEKKYACKNYGEQGISVNCSDVYKYNIDCQWVDVTDLPPGDYTFKVAVNPQARVPEQGYHNNAAVCQLRLAETYARVYGCELTRP